MANPLVSVVIPCFNAHQSVGEAIESALSQSYTPIEVVVIDDGSTDNSLEIIRSFNSRVRWESGPNRGGCAARNRGVQLATGDLIQFLDADDLLHAHKLRTQIPFAVKCAEQITYCDYETRNMETGNLLDIQSIPSSNRAPLEFALTEERLTITAPVHWRRNLMEIGGFRTCLACGQEYDLHLRLAASGYTFHHLNQVLFTVRKRHGSVSSDYAKVLRQHDNILQYITVQLSEKSSITPEVTKLLAAKYATNARQLLRLGDKATAKRYFEQAKLLHYEGGATFAYSPMARAFRKIAGNELTEFFVLQKRWLQRIIRINKH